MDDMDVSAPSVCQECKNIYFGGFTNLELFAGRWMCPSCIEIEKNKSQVAKNATKAAQGAESRTQKIVKTVEAKITACVACGGTVSISAKSCPHCGQSKPAPKASSKVTGKHLLLAFLFLMLVSMFWPKTASISAEEVVSRCTMKMGINPNSSTPITMSQIRALDECVNSFGFKTKQ